MWETDFNAVEQAARAAVAELTDKELKARYTARNGVQPPRRMSRAALVAGEVNFAKNLAMAREVEG